MFQIKEIAKLLKIKILPKTKKILKEICKFDNGSKTEFEYSIRIIKGKIDNSLRIVNYDNFSYKNFIYYGKRIKLLKNIIECANGKIDKNLFEITRRLKNFRRPLYVGLEQNKKETKIKFYINFYSIKDLKKLKAAANSIFGKNKLFIKNRYFPLIGVDAVKSKKLSYKIYYLYSLEKEKNVAKKLKIKNIINYLDIIHKKYSSQNYFVISERYLGKKKVGAKIENGIKETVCFRDIIKCTGIKVEDDALNKIIYLMNKLDSYLKVIIREKDSATFYFRL